MKPGYGYHEPTPCHTGGGGSGGGVLAGVVAAVVLAVFVAKGVAWLAGKAADAVVAVAPQLAVGVGVCLLLVAGVFAWAVWSTRRPARVPAARPKWRSADELGQTEARPVGGRPAAELSAEDRQLLARTVAAIPMPERTEVG